MRYLELNVFLELHKNFINIPTWTTKKKAQYKLLEKYLNGCIKSAITSDRDSQTTKVHIKNSLTIFKVHSNQLGTMKIYRNKWVLMYMSHRSGFTHYLNVYPLKKGIDKNYSELLKNSLGNYYVDMLEMQEPHYHSKEVSPQQMEEETKQIQHNLRVALQNSTNPKSRQQNNQNS